MELKKVKTRHAGKCARCQREIKQGWDVKYSPETKAVYCLQCAEVLENEPVNVPENLELNELIGSLSLKIDHYANFFNVMNTTLNAIEKKLDERTKKILECIRPELIHQEALQIVKEKEEAEKAKENKKRGTQASKAK